MDQQSYSDALHKLSARRRFRSRVHLLMRVYSWIGLLLSIVAGGYFLLTLLPFALSEQQQLALMVAGVGVLLSVMSKILVTFYKAKETGELERQLEDHGLDDFLVIWARFERVGKRVLEDKGSDHNVHSLRSVFSSLYDDGKINREDLHVLEDGLRFRNAIVHGNRVASTRAMEHLTTSLEEIVRKIAPSAKETQT